MKTQKKAIIRRRHYAFYEDVLNDTFYNVMSQKQFESNILLPFQLST